jgi:hypothetical protein
MEVPGPEWLAINLRDVGVAGSNVTQTTDFTSVFRDQTHNIIDALPDFLPRILLCGGAP